MAKSLPAPMTPPDCEVRGLGWFKLHVDRLQRSSWWKRASDLARSRNIDLWCEAWKQVPAASLPNDDFELAGFAGFGRDAAAFAGAKREIMSQWVLCSDNRLYHPVLAEVAIEAFETTSKRREFERDKKRRQRDKRKGLPAGNDADVPRGNGDRLEENRTDSPTEGNDQPVENVEPTVAPSAEKPPAKTKAARGTRIPWDWTASGADLAYAEREGFSLDETRRIEDAFFDFWKAKAGPGGVKLDWPATWRTWIRNQRSGGRYGTGNRASGPGASRPSDRDHRISSMHAGAVEALDRRRRGA